MRSIGGWGVGYGAAIDAQGECAKCHAFGGWGGNDRGEDSELRTGPR